MLSSFLYNIKEAFRSIIRNQAMSLASIVTVTTSLFIFGTIMCLVFNLNNITSKTQDQFNTINIYIKDGVTKDRELEINKLIKSMDNVQEVFYESKEDALTNLKNRWGDKAYLLDNMNNPLQNSFIVNTISTSKNDVLVENIKQIEGVEDIIYYKDAIDQLAKIVKTVNNLGLALMGVLVLVSIFVISTTISLTINARKNEIFIMKYIGATNWFVRWPFIIEGMILGLIGALIAIALIFFMYKGMYNFITLDNISFINGYILNLEEIIMNIVSIFISMGIGIGTLGAVLSVRKYMEA